MTATISDHLPQFAIILNMFGNILGNKPNIYERDWSKFDRESFILDYFSVDWQGLLKIDELNTDNSTQIFLDKINMLLDTHAPLKRVNKLLSHELQKYRNLLSTLMKKSKQAYYTNILKEIGIMLRTHGKELKALFLQKL